MSYSRTDVLQSGGSLPQAMSALAAAAGALSWRLAYHDSDTLKWNVAHGIVNWKIAVCASLWSAGSGTTILLTSHTDAFGSSAHVDEAAAALQGPVRHALPLLGHYGSPAPFSQGAGSPPPQFQWHLPPAPPIFTTPRSQPADRTPAGIYRPPNFTPWPGPTTATLPFTTEEPEIPGSPSPGGSGPEEPGGPAVPEPEPPKHPAEPQLPKDGGPLESAATAQLQRADQLRAIAVEISRVQARLGGVGPVQHQLLEEKLAHLKTWQSELHAG